jgi:hypothetical protein
MGTERTGDAVVVDGEATLEAPPQFAPGHENITFRYSFRRGPTLTAEPVVLTIKDKDNNTLVDNGMLGLGGDRTGTYEWNGQDSSNNLIEPKKAPLTATLKIGNNLIVRTVTVNVKVAEIRLWTRTNSYQTDSILMNTPDGNLDVVATVMVRNIAGGMVAIKTAIEVNYSFEADANNAVHTNSFEYSGGHRLGKKDNASAVFWERDDTHHPTASDTSSGDSYRQTCKVKTLTTAGADLGKAFIRFKPSGVGGDKYKIWAMIVGEDSGVQGASGIRERVRAESHWLTVWRRVSFTAHEMTSSGQDHVSRLGTEAIQGAYYTNNSTFVHYSLGAVTAIDSAKCVQYIGLWDHATGAQRVWNTHKVKDAGNSEVPSATDITDSNRTPDASFTAAQRDAARSRVRTCAERWRDRIINAYTDSLNNWPTDAGVPTNTVVAAEYEHPKYSADAPDSDSVTGEWSGANLTWLTIRVEGSNIHPDARWVYGQGFSRAERAYIFACPSDDRLKKVIAHEIGHETKSPNQFRRANFRPASVGGRGEDTDHSPNPGLMDPSASRDNFTDAEKSVLKGMANP